jgi:hypothetical protein
VAEVVFVGVMLGRVTVAEGLGEREGGGDFDPEGLPELVFEGRGEREADVLSVLVFVADEEAVANDDAVTDIVANAPPIGLRHER